MDGTGESPPAIPTLARIATLHSAGFRELDGKDDPTPIVPTRQIVVLRCRKYRPTTGILTGFAVP